ncbi:hypothetical protein SAMN05192576_1756 [Nocardioides szechwanensis]|uniref:Uncharacterized protein n=2 Tax=Nocardioides szechwanensis TaxID=1005944 RepID=A0A1G9ZKB5_9ACTN|nr:hypothetical protein SAMN05192576_1756 [Nocardioides szechwanensis]
MASACSGSSGASSRTAALDATWPPSSALAIEEPTPLSLDAPPTKAAAVKYASYLIDQIDYALRTTFPAAVLERGTDRWGQRCEVCDEVVELAQEARAERQLYEFDDWSGYLLLARELEVPQDPAAYWQLRMMLWQPEIRTLDALGRVVETTPYQQRETVLVLGVFKGEWRVFAWDFLDPAAAA